MPRGEVKVRLVRAPHTSGYNKADVREESIVTFLLFALRTAGVSDVDVADFHLDPHLTLDRVIDDRVTHFVIAVRETGANVHYALRLADALSRRVGGAVALYGQTGRLSHHALSTEAPITVLPHDENAVLNWLGVVHRQDYARQAQAASYFEQLDIPKDRLWRRRASLETQRGCHFKCRFCFQNHGHNYPTRLQWRDVPRIVHDIIAYQKQGIRHVVFHDSEFIGADAELYRRHESLLKAIRDETPGCVFSIYSRADTLARFPYLDLAMQAGLWQVFIGVESFADRDLRAMGKGTTATRMVEQIKALRDRGVYMNLSFMLFNRGTTVDSLRENLRHITTLAEKNRRYLGVPNFLFSFEASWTDGSDLAPLSDRYYLRWMVWKRAQPAQGVVFDPALEPLAEICRLAMYELVCQVTTVNERRALNDGDGSLVRAAETWFDALWPFAAAVLQCHLDALVAGRLTMSSLPDFVPGVYRMIDQLNELLPPDLRQLHTWEGHGSLLAAGKGFSRPQDHGWEHAISEGGRCAGY